MIIDDPDVLAPSALENKVPPLGILVSIEEAYTQCSTALIRSELWNAQRHIDRSELPSSGTILRSLTQPGFDAEEYDRGRAQRYARRGGLYETVLLTDSPAANVRQKRAYDTTRRQKQGRRAGAAIIDAAERFPHDGYANTTITAIATAVGVSPDTIYKCFGGKPGLIRAIRARA